MTDETRLNLVDDPWLPVRRRSGRTDTIAPWAVNDRIDTDPVTAFAWPRPELNAASLELLIGMLATGLPPAGDPDAAWQWDWSEPPGPDALRARLKRLAPFFELIADNAPAFLQDLDPLADAGVSNPARLLFDTPGARTAKLNTDLFRRRAADDTVLSLPAAAIALYAHMSWCASDGVGYRVALRGGGPLVTLPVLGHRRFGDTLWGQAWPAVRIAHDEDPDWAGKPEKVFAWLAPTPTSRPGDGNPPLGPGDMHALHVHWGMPRRVRLLAGPAAGRACAVTGERAATAIVGVRMRNYGIDYASGYRHPHTPDYRVSDKSPRLPVLTTARSARGDRLKGLIESSGDGLRGPASAMWRFPARAGTPEATDPRMRCFGIDADKAKVVGWIDRTIPLPLAGTLAGVNAVTTCLHPLCDALDAVTGMLRNALKRAARQPAPDTVAARLAEAFEPALLAAWREAAESEEATPRAADRRLDPGLGRAPEPTDPSRSIRAAAMRKLQSAALALFDELAPCRRRRAPRPVRPRRGPAPTRARPERPERPRPQGLRRDPVAAGPRRQRKATRPGANAAPAAPRRPLARRDRLALARRAGDDRGRPDRPGPPHPRPHAGAGAQCRRRHGPGERPAGPLRRRHRRRDRGGARAHPRRRCVHGRAPGRRARHAPRGPR